MHIFSITTTIASAVRLYHYCIFSDNCSGLSLRGGTRGFPWLLRTWPPATFIGKQKKIEPKEIPSCLISHLLVVFTQQLEILVTALTSTTVFVCLFVCFLYGQPHHQNYIFEMLSNCFSSYEQLVKFFFVFLFWWFHLHAVMITSFPVSTSTSVQL